MKLLTYTSDDKSTMKLSTLTIKKSIRNEDKENKWMNRWRFLAVKIDSRTINYQLVVNY